MKAKTIEAHYRGKKNWAFFFEPKEPGELIMLVTGAGSPDHGAKNPLQKGDLCLLTWVRENHFEGWSFTKKLKGRTWVDKWLSYYHFLFDS